MMSSFPSLDCSAWFIAPSSASYGASVTLGHNAGCFAASEHSGSSRGQQSYLGACILDGFEDLDAEQLRCLRSSRTGFGCSSQPDWRYSAGFSGHGTFHSASLFDFDSS